MAKKQKSPVDQQAIDAILMEELSVQDEELKPDARLVEDLKADPDDVTYIVVRLEDELGIVIPDGAEDEFITIKDIYDCIARTKR